MGMIRHDHAEAHHPAPGGELLWAMRAWVIGTCRGVEVQTPIRTVLATVARPQAADALFGMMAAVGDGALRKLTIACVCEKGVSDDERLLLDVVALYQHERGLEAMMRLRSILPAEAALAARDHADSLADALAASGYWLAAPSRPTTQQAFVPATVH